MEEGSKESAGLAQRVLPVVTGKSRHSLSETYPFDWGGMFQEIACTHASSCISVDVGVIDSHSTITDAHPTSLQIQDITKKVLNNYLHLTGTAWKKVQRKVQVWRKAYRL